MYTGHEWSNFYLYDLTRNEMHTNKLKLWGTNLPTCSSILRTKNVQDIPTSSSFEYHDNGTNLIGLNQIMQKMLPYVVSLPRPVLILSLNLKC